MFPECKLVNVDLTSSQINIETLDSELYQKYPGGSSLGAYLLLQRLKPGIDPLSEDNILVFSVSPLTGLPISGQSRMVVTSKSPLSMTVGDSQAGGYLPAHIKGNGYDAIVFSGKAEKPVYLYIDGPKIELRNAEHLWGKVTKEAQEEIRREIGEDKVDIAQIGPAGENLVRYSCIINDLSRANGRLGFGAVMGSKNLKAIVVKRNPLPKPLDADAFKLLSKEGIVRVKENPSIAGLKKYGTSGLVNVHNAEGFLVTNNWTLSHVDSELAYQISGEKMYDTILKTTDTCTACAVRCKRVVEIPGIVDAAYGGPEYESIATLGSYCGVFDIEKVATANMLCNMYGLDTISCGATIAFAMECFESGFLTLDQTEGEHLSFGNGDALITLIHKIARREGYLGELLAAGSRFASETLGESTRKFVIASKGNEYPAHMPHCKPSLSLIYAINPAGADHQSSEHDTMLMAPEDSQPRKWLKEIGLNAGVHKLSDLDEYRTKFAYETQKYYSMLDSLSLCQFCWGPAWQLYGPEDLLLFCKSGIGWETSYEELLEIGERRINMLRLLSAREGMGINDDTIPERMFEPLPTGPQKGICIDRAEFEHARNTYYELAGWDTETGNPTAATLAKLGLQDFI